jgi:hypothetical protein
MSTAVPYAIEAACAECGRFGAYAFDGDTLCAECYQARGSCCAERASCGEATAPSLAGETHRVSANCCYEACPRCSYVRRLREFQARHPDDWRARLRGSARAIHAAQQRE